MIGEDPHINSILLGLNFQSHKVIFCQSYPLFPLRFCSYNKKPAEAGLND